MSERGESFWGEPIGDDWLTEREKRRLPQWAQTELSELRIHHSMAMRDLESTRAASSILHERSWFTIPGPPPSEPPLASRKLWYLNADQPFPACTLYKGDVLLIGRGERYIPPERRDL